MKNIVLKSITALAVILFVLSACCMDSENLVIPLTVNLVSMGWLAIFAKANGYMN